MRSRVQAIKENLKEQGVPVVKVSLYGYVENLDDPEKSAETGRKGILSSASSPRKGPPQPSPEPSKGEAGEMDPEEAAHAYKQRMAQSNVSFA